MSWYRERVRESGRGTVARVGRAPASFSRDGAAIAPIGQIGILHPRRPNRTIRPRPGLAQICNARGLSGPRAEVAAGLTPRQRPLRGSALAEPRCRTLRSAFVASISASPRLAFFHSVCPRTTLFMKVAHKVRAPARAVWAPVRRVMLSEPRASLAGLPVAGLDDGHAQTIVFALRRAATTDEVGRAGQMGGLTSKRTLDVFFLSMHSSHVLHSHFRPTPAPSTPPPPHLVPRSVP